MSAIKLEMLEFEQFETIIHTDQTVLRGNLISTGLRLKYTIHLGILYRKNDLVIYEKVDGHMALDECLTILVSDFINSSYEALKQMEKDNLKLKGGAKFSKIFSNSFYRNFII